MRRFACRNFQINTNTDSKLSYTPCYMQCGNTPLNYLRRMKPFCFIFCGWKIKI